MLQNLFDERISVSEQNRAIRALLEQNLLFRRYFSVNFASQRQIYAALNRLIKSRYDFPFTMVDVSCGDASMMARALSGTKIERYIGIDLSNEVLNKARQNMDKLDCQKSFIQSDFYEVAQMAVERMDIIWLNLTIHHLSDRQKHMLIQNCSDMLSGKGCLLVYDPIKKEIESREQYVQRWWSCSRTIMHELTRHTPTSMLEHAYNDDFPCSFEQHQELGWECGFSEIQTLFTDPLNCYRLISYSL